MNNHPELPEPDELSDAELIRQFENLSLDKRYFNHLGHLRVAWIYLNQLSLDAAIEKACRGIQSYASSLGAEKKFHRTITEALIRIIAERINQSQPASWSTFLAENQDLVDNADKVLATYYLPEQLTSQNAAVRYVKPSLKTIDKNE